MKHLVILLLLSVSALVPLGAHDGHGKQLVLSGTIKTVLPERIELETFDQTMLQLKRVWVITNAKTKYVRAKKHVDVETAQPTAGECVVAVVSSEHTEDKSERLIALQIELNTRTK